MPPSQPYVFIRFFDQVGSHNVAEVGGKNASLGEMIRNLKKNKIRVPNGFATTAQAYRYFIEHNHLEDKIRGLIDDFHTKRRTLSEVGKKIRSLILNGNFPKDLQAEILRAYHELEKREGKKQFSVALRSSATAEDLPEASFAGQLETFLNISGEKAVLDHCRRCFASLFTNRAIVYRDEKGFDQLEVAISVGVQKMVRSDKGSAGVMFSIDTETGFPKTVVINAAWGLGENVVNGSVNPDEYMVFKPLLDKKKFSPIIQRKLGSKEKKLVYTQEAKKTTRNIACSTQEQQQWVLQDSEILQLARWAVAIEKHYQKPMDMEWARDGLSGQIYIVQARPETVQSQKKSGIFKSYHLQQKGTRLLSGLAIGEAIATGQVCRIDDVRNIKNFREGSILVTKRTDPDWVPIMKKAAGIITDQGGRTSHAAIVSRELGLPAVIGTSKATSILRTGQTITLSCVEGSEGYVYDAALKYKSTEIHVEAIPKTRTPILVNVAQPQAVFRWWQLPIDGVGLARLEFVISNSIKIHPMALVHFKTLSDVKLRREIEKLTSGYTDKTQYFVDRLAQGIAKIAAFQFPKSVIVRFSDFKSNEYAGLIGGEHFELKEENPMIGFRGASRYYHERYRKAFALECKAILKVRREMGLDNVIVMIPFCRSLQEADRVLELMAQEGLRRGKDGLQVYVMAEIPANVFLAEAFAKRFDGFSIGSNDLTQLVLGIDRDSEILSPLFDERNEAVKTAIRQLIASAHRAKSKVGICGEAPSNYPDFAEFLLDCGIDSISLNPDSVARTKAHLAKIEKRSLSKKKKY